MKIIITEKQLSILKEQNSLKPVHTAYNSMIPTVKFVYENYNKFKYFVDVLRPKIEEMGKKLYPANDMVSKNPKAKQTPEYRDLKDKEDAYDHQLASAMAASMFGPLLSDLIGKANEIRGGLRMFFHGAPSKGIGKFEQFTSGWEEDNANNKIGIDLGSRYRNKDIKFLSDMVVKNIEMKNYYDSTGNKKK